MTLGTTMPLKVITLTVLKKSRNVQKYLVHTLIGTILDVELFGLLRSRVTGMSDLFSPVIPVLLFGRMFSPITLTHTRKQLLHDNNECN